jgi:hypothetical protein
VARGDIVTIADGATALRPLADAAQSLVVNNPNNGRVYVAADELPTKLFFDYLVQPNTAARLPGLFRETVGLLYQDLTGAGTAGQVEIYRSNRLVDAPEYGPVGSATSTSFANVDLAQVATPGAPASGFTRLFASAVDQQVWAELPSGVLIPVSQQAKLQLDSTASTDLASGTAIAASTWTDLTSTISFNVDDANSVVEIAVGGNVVGVAPSSIAQITSRMLLDGSTTKKLGGSRSPVSDYGNFLAGAKPWYLTSLSAGAHTVKVQLFATSAGVFYCRPASLPDLEFLSIQVMEYKR